MIRHTVTKTVLTEGSLRLELVKLSAEEDVGDVGDDEEDEDDVDDEESPVSLTYTVFTAGSEDDESGSSDDEVGVADVVGSVEELAACVLLGWPIW